MKSIQITIKIPEKQEIIDNIDSFTEQQIELFVKDFGDNDRKYWSKTRETEKYTEYYSLKTSTVYWIDKGGYYFKIYFKENRPTNIAYGILKDSKPLQARAWCTICNTLIFSCKDLIGRQTNSCNCKDNPR